MKNYIDEQSDELKEKTMKNVILNLAETLIHETVHVSRRVAVPENAIKIKNDMVSLVMNDIAQNFSKYNYSVASDILLPVYCGGIVNEAEYEDLFYDVFKEDYYFFLEDFETITKQEDFYIVEEATSEFHQIIEKHKKNEATI